MFFSDCLFIFSVLSNYVAQITLDVLGGVRVRFYEVRGIPRAALAARGGPGGPGGARGARGGPGARGPGILEKPSILARGRLKEGLQKGAG